MGITMGNVVVVGYWDIRGLGGPIRLLLEYAGVPYENRLMVMPKPDWLEYKKGLGFSFPNLPYYQEGDLKIIQSNAILRHLGRKHGLDGDEVSEHVRIDMLSDIVVDYRNMMTQICYNPNCDANLVKKWREESQLVERMAALERFLVSGGGPWWAGNKLTWLDFLMWEILDQHRLLFPGCLDGLKETTKFMTKFQNLDKIKKYLSDPRYKQFPIWSVRARYGYFPTPNMREDLEPVNQ